MDILKKSSKFLLITTVFVVLVACGGRGDTSSSDTSDTSSSEETSNKPAVATMPAAQFQSVGNQSAMTNTVAISETTDVEGEASPDLALGERVYTNHCQTCHGEQAAGGSANALTGFSQEIAEFEDLLRTGGEVGPDHLFGTRKVSANGLNALHAYLQSLGG